MPRLQAYKFELGPNGKQQRLMRRFAGSRGFGHNKALAMRRERSESFRYPNPKLPALQ